MIEDYTDPIYQQWKGEPSYYNKENISQVFEIDKNLTKCV